MREEFSRDTSLNEMAQFVNLSPSRLRYLFKTHVGKPPAQYLRAFRMQRAKELLETTFLSVKEIRNSIGVNDHSHFIREFKKSYGMTPATLQRMRPHILIIDIGLPNEDGYALIRKARALFDERGEQIPAVALAPYPGLEDAQEAISAGFQLHIPKPPALNQLIEAVARLTGRTEASSSA